MGHVHCPVLLIAPEEEKVKSSNVAGILITTKYTYRTLKLPAEYAKDIGCGYLAMVPTTSTAKFMAYCDDEAALKDDSGMNDLATHVMDILGFNIMAFIPYGVRGNIVITGDDENLSSRDASEIIKLCESILALEEEEKEEDGLDELLTTFAHLRKVVKKQKKISKPKKA